MSKQISTGESAQQIYATVDRKVGNLRVALTHRIDHGRKRQRTDFCDLSRRMDKLSKDYGEGLVVWEMIEKLKNKKEGDKEVVQASLRELRVSAVPPVSGVDDGTVGARIADMGTSADHSVLYLTEILSRGWHVEATWDSPNPGHRVFLFVK